MANRLFQESRQNSHWGAGALGGGGGRGARVFLIRKQSDKKSDLKRARYKEGHMGGGKGKVKNKLLNGWRMEGRGGSVRMH